jgi:dynein heavy chain
MQDLPLQELLKKNIMNLKEEIGEISEIASKEKMFERVLNKMKAEWKPIKLELQLYKETETYILK